MTTIFIYILVLSIGILLGWIAHTLMGGDYDTSNGKIIIDHNENGDERIVFALDLEYEDFKRFQKIIFDVVNNEVNKND